MVWRIPTRDIGGTPFEEGLELPPEYITRNESEYFYSIAKNKINFPIFQLLPHADFDAIDELSGNLGGLHLPPAQQTSQEYGAYLRKQRHQQQCKGHNVVDCHQLQDKIPC